MSCAILHDHPFRDTCKSLVCKAVVFELAFGKLLYHTILYVGSSRIKSEGYTSKFIQGFCVFIKCQQKDLLNVSFLCSVFFLAVESFTSLNCMPLSLSL